MTVLTAKSFNFLPSEESSIEFGLKYRMKVKDTLELYIEEITEKLELNLSDLLESTRSLDPNQRFKPSFHWRFFKLREALRTNNVASAYDTLAELINESGSVCSGQSLSINSILSEYWELDFIRKMRTLHIRDDSEKTGTIYPVLNEISPRVNESIRGAIELLKLIDRGMYSEFNVHVNGIKLFNGSIIGFSSQEAFGNLYIRLPAAEQDHLLFFVEHLVHETSHLHLHAMSAFDKFTLNSPLEKFKAPIRTDLRPMKGIFHAFFVLARMLKVFKTIESERLSPRVSEFVPRIQSWYEIAHQTVLSEAKLTDAGKEIFTSIESEVHSL